MSDLSNRIVRVAALETVTLGDVYQLAREVEALESKLAEANRDWTLALASALGMFSGLTVPLVPDVEACRNMFDRVRERDVRALKVAHSDSVAAVRAQAERKLAALKEPVEALRSWLENDEPGMGMGLVEDMWAVVNILDGKG